MALVKSKGFLSVAISVSVFLLLVYRSQDMKDTHEIDSAGPVIQQKQQQQQQQQQEFRLVNLRHTCSGHLEMPKDPYFLDGLTYFSPQHNLFICLIPKSASTTMRQFLCQLANTTLDKEWPLDPRKRFWPFRKPLYDMAEKNAPLNGALKVVFVRDPLKRLVSTYHQMELFVTKGIRTRDSFQRYISHNRITKASFGPSDMVNYMKHTSLNDLNNHTKPQWLLCPVCSVDFLGHVETIEEDMEELSPKIGLEEIYQPEHLHIKASGDNNSVNNFFSALSDDQIKFLFEFYKLDFELFDYQVPDVFLKFADKGSE